MNKRKLLSFALALVMLVGIILGIGLTASAEGNTATIASPDTTGAMTVNLHIHTFTAYRLDKTNVENDTIIATCTDKEPLHTLLPFPRLAAVELILNNGIRFEVRDFSLFHDGEFRIGAEVNICGDSCACLDQVLTLRLKDIRGRRKP